MYSAWATASFIAGMWGRIFGASAISVAGLLDRVDQGVVPAGSRVVLTVTGHGLKDPQWALRNADGTQVEPTVVDATTSEVASVLDLVPEASA